MSRAAFTTDQAAAINQARGDFVRETLPWLKKAAELTTALDVGCGALGYFSGLLAKLGFDVTGSDGRPENVDEAQKQVPGVRFEVQDIEQTPRPGVSYDLVFCFGLLYHLENPFRAIRNLAELTGKCLLVETAVAPERSSSCVIYEEAEAANQGLTYLALVPSENACIKLLYRAGFSQVYRCVRPPKHVDFRRSVWRGRMRTVLLACKEASLEVKERCRQSGFVPVREPRARVADVNQWNSALGDLRQLFANPRSGIAKLADRILDHFPEAWLARLYEYFASAPATAVIPGWVMGRGDCSKNPLNIARRFLFRRLPRHSEIALKWRNDLRVRLFPKSEISRELFVSGCYEPNEMAFLEETVKPGMVVIDVGANMGLYTLVASRLVGEQGLVVSLEPSQREYQRLSENLRLNRCGNVRPLQVAASSTSGQRSLLLSDEEHSGHSTFGQFVYESVQTTGKEAVRTVELDEVARQYALTSVDVIKIDAEGHEWFVLQGSRELLKKFRPVVLMELNESSLAAQGCKRSQIEQLMKEAGYRLLHFNAQDGRLVALDSGHFSGGNVVAMASDRVEMGSGSHACGDREVRPTYV